MMRSLPRQRKYDDHNEGSYRKKSTNQRIGDHKDKVDYPFLFDWLFGGDTVEEHERHEEED